MAKRAGTYRSEKRRKEISRLKKQEEKRQRRFGKKESDQQGTEIVDSNDKIEQQGN